MNKRRKSSKFLRIWFIVLSVIAVAVITFQLLLSAGIINTEDIRSFFIKSTPGATTAIQQSGMNENSDSDSTEVKIATIVAVGDILVHSTQLNAQYDEVTGQYSFTNNFSYIREYIENADYAVANFETTMAGNSWRDYSGYPSFNTPDDIADALKLCGFDMLLTANNHIYDSAEAGFFRTLNVLKEKGFDTIGARTELSQKKYCVKELNGIKIGFANFGYETTQNGGAKALNGITLSAKVADLVDTYMPEQPEPAYDIMETIIEDMKADGAEFIIFFIHWGNEYQTSPDHYQIQMAKKLSDMGVDAIIGGHPHVLQPIDVVTGTSGRKTLVAYSTGNFISNQRFELMDLPTSHTEDGMILAMKIEKNNTGNVSIKEIISTPTWVHKYFTALGKPVYEIVPLEKALSDPAAYNLYASSDAVARADASLQNTLGIMLVGEEQVKEAFKFNMEGKIKQ